MIQSTQVLTSEPYANYSLCSTYDDGSRDNGVCVLMYIQPPDQFTLAAPKNWSGPSSCFLPTTFSP